MTNEELTVMARMAQELVDNRQWLVDQQKIGKEMDERVRIAENDSKELMAECNRLRESEANALNSEREAVCDRDEVKSRLQDAENCLKALYFRYRINAGSPVLKLIKAYTEKYGVEIPEEGMAK